MAKFEDLPNRITDLETEWDGHSGMEVEDFISRKIEEVDNNTLVDGTYEDEILKLIKKDGSSIDIPVTVQEPTYSFGIYIYGLRVDGKIITRDLEEQILQYKKDKTFELGIAMYAISTIGSNQSDRVGSFPVKIKYGANSIATTYSVVPISYKYFTFDDSGNVSGLKLGEGEDDITKIVKWIKVNDIFSQSRTSEKIYATIQNDKEVSNIATLTDVFPTPITIQIISLSYTGNIVVNSTQLSFTLNGANSQNYLLEVYNQDEKVSISSGFECPLKPGLNQLIARATNKSQPSIKTDWYSIDVISTVSCTETVVAVNGVTEGIDNNKIATLYNLTVFSPKKEDTSLITYLSEYDPGLDDPNPEEQEQLKTQIITSLDYNEENVYETSYYKYIENRNTEQLNRYLFIKVNNNFYSFHELVESDEIERSFPKYKIMPLKPVNYDYCYEDQGVTYSFDQINGYVNNVFITDEYSESVGLPSNISKTLETSDGWKEDKGVIYFKASAQNNPILTLTDLNLDNNFTFELGFKTYNVSDETKPFLNLGKLQFRPNQVCWDIDTSTDNGLATFNARNSLFQEETRTHIIVTVQKDFTIKKGDTYYPDYLYSFQEGFDQAMSSTSNSNNKFNLVRIFINDVIDREFILTNEELQSFKTATLTINPTTTDVDFYLLRVYNQKALDFDQVQKNYISFLSNDVSKDQDDPKTDFFNKNDILGQDGEISFTKTYSKYNTIVLVFPKDPLYPDRTNYFPSRAWGGVDNADPTPNDNLAVTMFINYQDQNKNKNYGGRAINIRVRDQGTSASRYFIWNVDTRFNKGARYVPREDGTPDTSQTEEVDGKFVPYKNLDETTNRFKPDDDWADVIKKGYIMPPYNGRLSSADIKSKKNVGKVNYASSMQSHKIGFCNMYDDFYQSQIKVQGRKAVQQEPFIYFYWYTNLWYVDQIELQDLFDADSGISSYGGKLKFMGFQTWGSGKKDDETSGYSDDATPGYLMLEGGENGDTAVNFRCPWQELQRNPISWAEISDKANINSQTLESTPQISYEESLEKPWERLWISGDESIIYDITTADVTGAWDVNYGLEEVEDEGGNLIGLRLNVGTDEEPNKYLRNSVKTFREFYDFVYTHDTNIVITKDGDTSKWTDTTKKYCCTGSSCTADVNHKANDVYRYSSTLTTVNEEGETISSGRWVPAGVKYDIEQGKWSSYNLVTDVGDSTVNSTAKAIEYLKKDFQKIKWTSDGLGGTLDTVDAAIHQAAIRLTSGTDNRAKNTYFRVTGPYFDEVPVEPEQPDGDTEFVPPTDYDENPRKYHYVGFLQDDVDTLLATDNNGLQTKPYNILEPSYREEDKKYWGDSGSNIFFRSFDLVYESEINSQLSKLIEFVFNSSPNINDTANRFYQYFFAIQDGFPAIAYNHTAKIYYELGQLVFNTGAIANFTSNDQQPIQQSHGSCINSEKQYMQKRLIFLGSQVLSGTVVNRETLPVNQGSGSGGESYAPKLKLEFQTYQDMYPAFMQTGPSYIYTNPDSSLPVCRRYLTEANKDYSAVINKDLAVNNSICLISYYKKLKIAGLESSSLGTTSYKRATKFEIDNQYSTEQGYAESNFTDYFTPSFPVVEEFTLANMELQETFDASTFLKAKSLNFSGTTTKYIILPSTGRLETVIFPNTITRFELYNNPGLLVSIDDMDIKKGIIFEGIDNLEIVNINCDKCGGFDVSEFCENLISCNSLKSITLKNANVYITEEALRKIVFANERTLTGDFYIVTEPGGKTLKAISFETKQMLVNSFGNIEDPESEIRIHFQSENILDFSCASEISVYYQTGESGTIVRQNMFEITVTSGNDVEIKSGSNPYNPEVDGYLDITYQMSGVGSDVATIDQTGAITLKKESSSTATVTISMKVSNSSQRINKTCKVSFKWKAPQIGDFAYADGTFTSSFDQTKTFIGLVYAKDETNETSGTVYIIGKEFSSDKGYYLGYCNDGSEGSSEDILRQLYQVSAYLKSISVSNYEVVEDIASKSPINNINVSTYREETNVNFTGQSDTKAYLDHVEEYILPKLYNNPSCRPYISRVSNSGEGGTQWRYYIENLSNLNSLCEAIRNVWTNASSTDIMSCLLYPYFYSMYLYEPAVKETETLHDSYKKGNWYAPSISEFSRIIYYRGYSVSGNNFNTGDMVRQPISTSVQKGSSTLSIPIFSSAYSHAGNQFPTVWSSIVGSGDNAGVNNITTSVNTSAAENYSYQRKTYYDTSYTYNNEWVVGDYQDPSYWNTTIYQNAWRLTKHQGVPFTKFNYSKNG